MFVQSGALEIPTTTVVLDLFSRVGSSTKYSLSPYPGMRGDGRLGNIVRELQSEGILEANVRAQNDDFKFSSQDAIYSRDQQAIDRGDDDWMEAMWGDGASEPEAYSPGQVAEPEYIRKFEDAYPEDYMIKFLIHFTANLANNNQFYSKYKRDHATLEYMSGSEDDDEIVNVGDMQTETLSDESTSNVSVQKIREDLIYCLYRFNLFSKRTSINVLSLVLAHLKLCKQCIKTDTTLPKKLIALGVYYADPNGDCTEFITNPQDLNLTRARGILTTKKCEASDFHNDFDLFVKLYNSLDVDLFAEDPRLYTEEFIRKNSALILVQNGHYIARAHGGGYSRDNYNKLLHMTLDEAAKGSVSVEVDELENAMHVILESENTPSDLYRRISNYSGDMIFNTAMKLIELMINVFPHTDLVTCSREFPNSDGLVDGDGFLLDQYGQRIRLVANKLLNANQRILVPGPAYVHASGVVVFGTVSDTICYMDLEDLKTCCENDYTDGDMIDTLSL